MAGWGDGLWGEQGWGGFTAFTSSVDETSTGSDAVSPTLSVAPAVSETGTGTDAIAAAYTGKLDTASVPVAVSVTVVA